MKNIKRLVLGSAAVALVAGSAMATSATAEPTVQATTVAWAKVSAGGTILGSSGITGINRFGFGRYNLFTNFNVGNCALTGTINTNGGGDPGPGSSSILVGAVNGNTLFVRTATPSSGGSKAVDDDRPFSVTIVC